MKTKICIAVLVFAFPHFAFRAIGQIPDQLKHSIIIPPADINDGLNFGKSVAVADGFTVVGAPVSVAGSGLSGTVKVFNSATGALLHVLRNPSSAVDDNFGFSVSVSGPRVVVGAYTNNTAADDSGIAYVYNVTSPTPTVPEYTLVNPAPGEGDYFGYSVAISGSRVVVGAYADSTNVFLMGSAYVYNLASGTPTVPATTLNNPTAGFIDGFGFSVAISGSRVVVGVPFRDFVQNDQGAAYVYDIAGITPTVPLTVLNNPAPGHGDTFGFSVAISGSRVVVGAVQDDATATDAGTAYVFDVLGPTPTIPLITLDNPAPAVGDNFGDAVAISGTRIVIGARKDDTGAVDAGIAYVFDLNSPSPTVPVSTLTNPTPAAGDFFATAVAIDGVTIAAGAPSDDSPQVNKGAAYLYGPSPYSLWKVSELGNQFAADLADADGDGVLNLGEYGLLRSPTVPGGATFSATSVNYPDGERLQLVLPRDPSRDDVTIEVQATGDLIGAWTTIASSTLGAPFVGPGYFAGDNAGPGLKSVEIRDTVKLPDAPQRYLRVRVRR